HNLDLERFASIEAQISGIADDIAYNNHDIEDGIRAKLFTIEQLFDLPLIGKKFKEIKGKYNTIEEALIVGEVKRYMVNEMVIDVIRNTKNNIKKHKIA